MGGGTAQYIYIYIYTSFRYLNWSYLPIKAVNEHSLGTVYPPHPAPKKNLL